MLQGTRLFSAVVKDIAPVMHTKVHQSDLCLQTNCVMFTLGKRSGADELSDCFCLDGDSYISIFYLLVFGVFLKLDTIDCLPL